MSRWNLTALLLMLACAVARAEEPAVPPEPPPKELPPDTLTPLPPKEGQAPKAVPPAEEQPAAPPDPAPPEKPANPPAETVDINKENPPAGVAIDPHRVARLADAELQAVRVLPAAPEFEAGKPAVFILRGPAAFLDGAAGSYVLKDETGRELAVGKLKLADLKAEADGTRRFEVDTRLAIESVHTLSVALVGTGDRRAERTAAFRIPRPAAWDGWVALVHAPYEGGAWRELRRLGVRGSLAYRMHAARFTTLQTAGVPYYVENIGRQFFSRYHIEKGLWERTLAAIEKDPDAREALVREPSLCSAAFAEAYAKELQRHAAHYKTEGPLFYSLASEPSVTRLGAACDFDFHPETLQEFRRWLERDAYGTLNTLNEYWSTSFKTWAEVVPMTTGEARLRLKDSVNNFAPWADFRLFMDLTFAKTLRDGAGVIRREDPRARVGITGALGPFAFGGWDWTQLAGALDTVEAYDIGGARALWRDLAPGKPALAAVPLQPQASALQEARAAIWTLALDSGPRGVLLWDEAAGPEGATARVLLGEDAKPTPSAELLGPTLRELDGPLGLLLANAKRARGGVGILYSPPSVRLHWLFEAHKLHGDGWLKAWGASTSAERRESLQLRLRESWCKLLADLGLPWRFVTPAELESGALAAPENGLQAIVLPRACALSDREAAALKAFAEAGGTMVADALCGRFDERARERKRPALDDLFGVDTSREPFTPEPERLLESPRDASTAGQAPLLDAQDFAALPPPYSDKPLWLGEPPARRAEYRKAPVLSRRAAGKGAAVFLNLALDDYMRWRLHPELPRAAAVQKLLAQLVFTPLLDAQPVKLKESTLPAGTELTWYTLGEGPKSVRLLALRRNPQGRLHELGQEGDSNELFARPEPFKLVLREKAWAASLLNDKAGVQTDTLEGTLDPVTPTIYALRAQVSPVPTIVADMEVKAGAPLNLQIIPGPGADAGPRVYGLRVQAPDGGERPAYGALKLATDGRWIAQVPLAYNDPAGTWSFLVRDATTGLESKLAVKVLPAE